MYLAVCLVYLSIICVVVSLFCLLNSVPTPVLSQMLHCVIACSSKAKNHVRNPGKFLSVFPFLNFVLIETFCPFVKSCCEVVLFLCLFGWLLTELTLSVSVVILCPHFLIIEVGL